MRGILLIVFGTLWFSSTGYSQYLIGFENNLGGLSEEIPYNHRVVDTVVQHQPYYQQKNYWLDSLNQYLFIDTVRFGEPSNSLYFNRVIPVSIYLPGRVNLTSKVVIDTNNVLFDTLSFNQFSSGSIQANFSVTNNSTIRVQMINISTVRSYYGRLNIYYDSLVKVRVTSDLPSMDTVFIGTTGIRYSSLPSGFIAMDTCTIKIDSVISGATCISSNNSGCTNSFNYVRSYNNFYFAFALFTWGINTGSVDIDLDTNRLYNNFHVYRRDSPYIEIQHLNDTIVMDSNSTLYFRFGSGKGNWVFLKTEMFKTETRIRIAQLTSLNENLQKNQLTVFPNPVQSILNLDLDSENVLNKEYRIFDIKGQLVQNGVFSSTQLDLKSLSKGMYFLAIPELQLNQKFIKE